MGDWEYIDETWRVVIPYQFRSVSMVAFFKKWLYKAGVVIPYQFRSVSISERAYRKWEAGDHPS